MAEAHNGLITILVACAVFVHIFVVVAIRFIGYSIRFRAQLHRAKRHSSARIGVPHPVSANHWFYILYQVLVLCKQASAQANKDNGKVGPHQCWDFKLIYKQAHALPGSLQSWQ